VGTFFTSIPLKYPSETLDNPRNVSIIEVTSFPDSILTPNRKEMRALMDYSQNSPALPTGHPFTNVQSTDFYWTSSTEAANSTYARILLIQDSRITNTGTRGAIITIKENKDWEPAGVGAKGNLKSGHLQDDGGHLQEKLQ